MHGGLMQLVAYGAQDMYLTTSDISSSETDTVAELFLEFTNITIENKLIDDICTICLDNFRPDDKIHETLCNHCFHHGCMYDHITN